MNRQPPTHTRSIIGWALLVLLPTAALMVLAAALSIEVPYPAQMAVVAGLVLASVAEYVRGLVRSRTVA